MMIMILTVTDGPRVTEQRAAGDEASEMKGSRPLSKNRERCNAKLCSHIAVYLCTPTREMYLRQYIVRTGDLLKTMLVS